MREIELKKGYKTTEVGIIPEEWECKKMGDLGECIIGLTYKPENVKPIGTLVLRASNITDNRLKFDDNVYVNMHIRERLITKKDDILICVRNGSRQLIGKCALIDEYAEGSTFGAFMSLFRSNRTHYIYHYFQSGIIKRQIDENIGATINQITNRNLKEFLIAIPNDDNEMNVISTVLNDIDNLIASLEKLIEKKQRIKQGTMQQLLTGKKRLSGFFGKWDKKRIGDIASVYSGGTPLSSNPQYYGGDIPWITSGDLNQGMITKVSGRISKKGLENSSAKMIKKDTLLLALYGATAGVVGISKIDGAINQAVLAIIPQEDDSTYLYYKLFYLKEWIIKTYTQGGQPNLSGEIIKSLEITIPKIDEQQAIAQILSDMDAEIETLEQKLAKYKAIKQGMMQELLTGRTRLI